MATRPGTIWAYNGGSSQIFSAIVTNKTGMNTLEFAKKEPLSVRWGSRKIYVAEKDRQGIYDAAGGIGHDPRIWLNMVT